MSGSGNVAVLMGVRVEPLKRCCQPGRYYLDASEFLFSACGNVNDLPHPALRAALFRRARANSPLRPEEGLGVRESLEHLRGLNRRACGNVAVLMGGRAGLGAASAGMRAGAWGRAGGVVSRGGTA